MATRTRRALRAGIIAVAASLLVLGTSFSGGAAAFADDGDLTFTTVPTWTTNTTGPVAVDTELETNFSGTWAPNPTTVTRQWVRDGVPIDGAINRNYLTTSDDAGHELAYRVTATLAGYTNGVVETPPVDVLPTASITGGGFSTDAPKAGQPISFTDTSTDPADAQLSFQWSRGTGSNKVDLATTQTYTPLESDHFVPLDLEVTVTAPGYLPRTEGFGTAEVAASVLNPMYVAIYGTPVVGVPTQVSSNWRPTPSSFTYQWLVNGKPIAGAAGAGATYTPTSKDVGKPLAVTVVASLDGYPSVTYTTAASEKVNRSFTGIPTPKITGTPMIGRALSVVVGKWTPAASGYDYQWMVGGVNAGNDTPTFTPAYDGWIGQPVTVIVTAHTDGYGPVASPVSAATANIVAGQVQAGTVAITGAVTNGQAFSQLKGWADGAHLTYTWSLGGVVDNSNHYGSYLIPLDALGKTLSLTITDTEADQTPVSATTSVVIGEGYYGISGTGLSLTGNLVVGGTVGVNESAWTPLPTGYSIWWYEGAPDDQLKHVATGSTYTIPRKYFGKNIYAQVTASGPLLHDGVAAVNSSPAIVGSGTFVTSPIPTIGGHPRAGSTLNAHHGTWSPSAGVAYTYRWYEQTDSSAIPVAISGATHSTLKLSKALIGDLVTVRVEGHLSHYVDATTTSLPTAAVVS